MLAINPINLKVELIEHIVAGELLKNALKGKKFKNIKEFNDFITNFLKNSKIGDLPADTRFPGFFSSLADHSLSTSAIAVPLALELRKRGIDFSS
ncbi:MAG: hypothetical protein QW566_11745, partial [Candidatus Jordarchaeales archaeon]